MGYKRIHIDRGRIVHVPTKFSAAFVNSSRKDEFNLSWDEFTLLPGEFTLATGNSSPYGKNRTWPGQLAL
jgi:hypothetical protein